MRETRMRHAMRRFNSNKRIICYIIVALVLCCLPSVAGAATQLPNDNHTDTDDYCMRANDVLVGLSEFASMTQTELENEIISQSSFQFRIRTSSLPWSEWPFLTSGYSVDFSALQEAATTTGYPIVVTLPPISLSTPSYITFRVFVVDDLPTPPPVFQVSYQFVSVTPGKDLPSSILMLKPGDTTGSAGDVFTPPATYGDCGGNGVWTFLGWDVPSQTVVDHDLLFIGSWAWHTIPEYNVGYQFVSTSSTRSLPAEVLALCPASATALSGTLVTPQTAFDTVRGHAGYWEFAGWDLPAQTVTNHDLSYTGSWDWVTLHYSTPTPALTPTPSPAAASSPSTPPSASAAPTPDAAPAPTEWSLQVIKNDDANNNENNDSNENTAPAAGGGLKMMIALVLTSIVALQVVGIASDLRVLKWYNAKKAGMRRTK